MWFKGAVTGAAATRVSLELSVSPIALDPIVVEVENRRMSPAERRAESFAGVFIGREEFIDRNPIRISDIFRTIPGALLDRDAEGGYQLRGTRDVYLYDAVTPLTVPGSRRALAEAARDLVSRPGSTSTFGRRRIRRGGVPPPRNSDAIPRRRALPRRCFASLGVSPYFRDGTLVVSVAESPTVEGLVDAVCRAPGMS